MISGLQPAWCCAPPGEQLTPVKETDSEPQQILGKDPGTALACYWFGVLFSWIGCAILT